MSRFCFAAQAVGVRLLLRLLAFAGIRDLLLLSLASAIR
ncbi:hypothetical protein K788_0009105 [Paraburkholderia caribensis MBA4]|uniref:Uncharacterized protein n=1 Tax=Paraburkholderia caribensis MBA4 TaxID=1323664 RepID=A0A0P0RJM3_9BURK|nr:hypothetical protein K788_0009105 [Paraburkholderia caribensis MBA4]